MSCAKDVRKEKGSPAEQTRYNVVEDFAAADLGDLRLNNRLQRIARAIAQDPSASLPQIFRDPSQLEAVYRLIDNAFVKPEQILDAHSG